MYRLLGYRVASGVIFNPETVMITSSIVNGAFPIASTALG
jgi:hypothetical protein